MSDVATGLTIDGIGSPDGTPIRRFATACRLAGMARLLGVFATGSGLCTLLSWTFNTTSRFWLISDAMQPLGALAFILAGAALAMAPSRKMIAAPFAAGALLIAVHYLLRYAIGWHSGLGRLLFDNAVFGEWPHRYAAPMAPLTSVALALFVIGLGLTLWSGRLRSPAAAQASVTAGLMLSGLALSNDLFRSAAPQLLHAYPRTTLQTAIALLALFVGLLLLSPQRFWLRGLLEDGEAGILARRLVPAVIAGPLVVDWLALRAAAVGIYSPDYAPALTTVLNAGLLSAIVLHTTSRLAQSARHRAELLETLDLSVTLVCAMDNTIRYWSAGCERLYGFHASQAVGRRAMELLHTEFPCPMAEIEADLNRDGEWRGELRHRTAGGRTIIVSSRWVVRRDRQGQCVGIAESNTDITALYAAREAAARAEAEFRASFEHSSVGKLQIEPLHGQILRANAALAHILGHDDAGALSGAMFWTLIHPDNREADRAVFDALVQGGTEAVLRETRQLRRDGAAVWVRISATLLRDARTGAPLRVLADVEDINARRAAEQELHDVAERYRRIFEDNPVGIAVSDLEEGRIFAANPAFCRMLEYSRAEIVGLTRNDVTHADDRLVGDENRHSNTLQPYEKRLVTKTGRVVLARIRVAQLALPDNDQPLLLGMIEDITGLRQTEAELRHSQRLESIGRLTGGIAHDFNNLLGVIIGNVEVLHEFVQDDTANAELTMAILDAAISGAELTRRLLAFARRQPLQPVVFDMNSVVTGQVLLLQRTLGERIQVAASLAPDLRRVLADPSQVADALLNLAINARDAMPNGGRLAIETRNARLAQDENGVPAGDYVMLSVADTGLGMPSDVLEHATTPFFTTKPPGVGTGLGLSMIYGYARQSGGHLRIDSTLGVGTTVRLYLPAADEDAVLARQEPGVAAPGGKESVLLVDDNVDMRNVAAHHMRALGYTVRIAEDVAAALALLRGGEHFDLLFTDLMMPGVMSGEELAAEARSLQPDLAVLLTTGYDTLRGGGDAGAEHPILHKPYLRRDLAEKVREALARGRG